jgi:hypothetical protein
VARLGLIEPRDTADITVTVRHRCPSFAFGSALGPHAITSWWWSASGLDVELLLLPGADDRAPVAAITAAIAHELSGLTDYRRHLDELAELP